MSDVFNPCPLPWSIWQGGLTLTHSDTDVTPECSVEFGVEVVRATTHWESLWVRVDFERAGFVAAKPHRDDEQLTDVTGYDIVPRREPFSEQKWRREEAEWLRTGVCPDPSFYFSTDSSWLEQVRQPWAERQRMSLRPITSSVRMPRVPGTGRSADDAVHFLLDGRDGYLEIIAAGFTWRAWPYGTPLWSDVSGEPVMSGEWTGGPLG